jgi:hypothetical protein
MSEIEEIAREALQDSYSEFRRARRTLLLVAGLLALIHLLTVHPYLRTARALEGLQASMKINGEILAHLRPEIERLQKAGSDAGAALKSLLDGTTIDMIDRFAFLGEQLRQVRDEGLAGFASAADGPAGTGPGRYVPQLEASNMPPIQQMQMPQMQAPLGGQMDRQGLIPGETTRQVDTPGPLAVSAARYGVLQAYAEGTPDLWRRMVEHGRETIVAPAYAHAQQAWDGRIRPRYLKALDEAAQATRAAAGQADAAAAAIQAGGAPEREVVQARAADLRAAADGLKTKREALAAVKIRHNATVDDALGSDWWQTVGGKLRFADAVIASVQAQFDAIGETAAGPADAIAKALELQQGLHDQLQERQAELERQFETQRKQLAALSGAGVIPVDLASFIGLYPLVLGLLLGLLLLRAAQARREAATMLEDLPESAEAAASEARETRLWLARRVLGDHSAGVPALLSTGLAAGALVWIALAAVQLSGSPVSSPLPAWPGAALGGLAVLAATAWDVAAIRRLAVCLSRS